jgi:hypothetical protein
LKMEPNSISRIIMVGQRFGHKKGLQIVPVKKDI